MEWRFTNDTPIYQQIMDIIKQQIAGGVLMAGQKMPSVREMALEAGVNPNTMQKALAELEREGLLYSQRTSGRFVSGKRDIRNGLQEELVKKYMADFLEKMGQLGYSAEDVVALLQKNQEEGEK